MILPCDNLTLRTQAAQRPAGALMQEGPHGPRVFISYLTEKILLDFLTAELDLQLRLEALSLLFHLCFSHRFHHFTLRFDLPCLH